MTIVAFMQNMWVNDPERVKALIAKYGDNYRLRLIHYALFAGCVSGRRLKAAFGEQICNQIVWEEASREIAGHAGAAPASSPTHIAEVIAKHRPDIVVCFGKIAGDAVAPMFTGRLILAPHPAARQADTAIRLRNAATDLRVLLAAASA